MRSPRMMWQYIYVTAIKSNQSPHTLKLLYTVYATSFRGWSKRSEPTRSAFYSWASGSERRASQGRHDFSARESHRENINKKTIRPTLLILSSLSVIKTTSFDTLVTPAVGPFNTQILGGGAKQRIERGSPSCMYKTTYTPPDGCRKLFRLNDAEIPLVKDFVFSSPWPSPFYYIGSEDVRKEENLQKNYPKFLSKSIWLDIVGWRKWKKKAIVTTTRQHKEHHTGRLWMSNDSWNRRLSLVVFYRCWGGSI